MAQRRSATRARRGSDGIEAVRVWLLGGFRVSVGSRSVGASRWRLKKAAYLVKLLALAPGHRLHRERIMEMLWPDLDTKSASNNLHRVLHFARGALEATPANNNASRHLTLRGDMLELCPEGPLWVDVEAFEGATATARRSREPAAYRAATELYAGELLPEDLYEEWTQEKREELRQLYLALLLDLAELYEEREEYGPGIEALRQLVSEEPTREEAHRGLMRLYTLSGQRHQAILQYKRLRETVFGELGTEPGTASRRLYEEIRAGRFPTVPSAAGRPSEEAVGTAPNNLPASLTSFVGRERKMMEIKRSLSMTRLLTLTGAGGSGKTRLVLEVARDLVGAYPDGVWLVELAPLSDPELIAQAVAAALGVREQPGRSIAQTLSDYLKPRQTLLVLDNCEHLVDDAARLAEALLRVCPKLRILATSREPLGISGEVVWTVPPLSLPEDRSSTIASLVSTEAVRLFVDRARSRLPAFEVTEENADAVARVCRKLEGIPLAIELAAARMDILAAEQIAERLDRALGLLTGGSGVVAPRHRTLRAALDWSYELLSEPERKVFRRLSVFAGGFTLEAAEAVGMGDGLEEGEVLESFLMLVDKSLVGAGPDGEGSYRYGMLEPVRQYAQEKLEKAGEGEEVRRRHVGFCLAFSEEAEPQLWGPEDRMWLGRLEAEHDNMRAALSWAQEQGEAELGLRLAGALWPFWEARGYYDEGRRWLEEALEKKGRASAAVRAKALKAVGWLAHAQIDLDRAEVAAQEGLKLSAEAEIGGSLAASFRSVLGVSARARGDYERAKELFVEGLALSQEADDKLGIVNSLLELGITLHYLGDRERANELYEEGIILAREFGYVSTLASLLFSQGYTLLLEGDYERGAALNEEAAALFRERGYKGHLEFVLDNLGWAALLGGDHERGRISLEESLTLCMELGDNLVASESLEGLACISGAEGASERAAKLFGAAEALREEVGSPQHTPEEEALREPYLAMARSQLDEVSWQEAWAEGRAMPMEAAIEYALSEEKLPPPLSPAPKRTSADEPPYLTRREREVAVLIGRGLTNAQIADTLRISKYTVANHVARILRKLDLPSRSQIAVWVTERRLHASE